jgi:GTP cyclohydrolase I
MNTVYLSLGSNIGEKYNYIIEAIKQLGENSGILLMEQAGFYETSPVGGVVQDDFLNTVLKIQTTLTPDELLTYIHEIEANLGRKREIHWGPRTIDIDILFFGKEEYASETLILPHKEVFNRLFVLVPLAELIDETFEYTHQVFAHIKQLSTSEQQIQPVAIDRLQNSNEKIEAAVHTILQAVGDNPEREGLIETPARVSKMYAEILSSQKKEKFVDYKLFENETTDNSQMILVKDIPFYSMCEHHMLPFFGKAHVAYIPNENKIIGLSKIPRLVDFASRKLSVQENITREIAETLQEILSAKAVAVITDARHMCIEMRGIKKGNSLTRTSFYLGEFDKNAKLREEFLEMIKS